ncbi:MAG TPA: aminodeoxychorismate lyase [Ferruginibacter sp.]|mgnify:FL=1|nr:aminodeoxychorismate lyase [Ferruginibacter sp.]
MEYINYNGKILEANKVLIGANSRGLRYGDGLFETIKSREGELLFAEDHFQRLWDGLELLQFRIPALLTKEKLQDDIHALLQKNKHNKLARVRLIMLRGNGGLYDEINHHPDYIIQTWSLPDNAGQWNSNGLTMGIYTDARKTRDHFSNLKHNNFLPYVMAALQAKKQKWNDALVLNDAGRVCDSSIANIFLVKNETISTVALEEGCIAGVMRKQVIRLLAENNINVQETAVPVEELLNADEVFLSNSIFNIRWVQSIGDKRYSNRVIQKIYSDIFSTILQ